MAKEAKVSVYTKKKREQINSQKKKRKYLTILIWVIQRDINPSNNRLKEIAAPRSERMSVIRISDVCFVINEDIIVRKNVRFITCKRIKIVVLPFHVHFPPQYLS